jgi:hypothetical protein
MDMAQRASRTRHSERGLTGTVDNTHIEVDWPKSLGFFGGLGAAIAFDLVPLPIAIFVASVPFLKLLNRPTAPKPQRFFSHVVDGAAKPVGGDAEGTIRWTPRAGGPQRSTRTRGKRSSHPKRSKGGPSK